MKQIAEDIRTALRSSPALAALVGEKVFWEFGGENEKLPMIAFTITELPGRTKDRQGYTAIIRSYGDDTDAASDVYDLAKSAMLANGYRFTGAQSGISDDNRREGVIEANFTIN